MTSIAESKTIAEAFLRRTKQDSSKIGFRYKKSGEWYDVSFAQHAETVRRISCGLNQLGVKKGDRISILGHTSLFWSQFDMATIGAGAITVPIYPTNTPEDTKYIINHSEAVLLFIDDFKNLQKLAAISRDCPTLKKVVVNFEVRPEDLGANFEIIHWSALYDLGLNCEGKLGAKFDQNMKDIKPTDIFTICYTSGTTGLPKGVVLTHSCMSSVMVDVDIAVKGTLFEDEVLLSFLPMSHIFGKFESMTPYYFGWTSAFAESIESLVSNLGEIHPTAWIAVPRIFEKVYSKIMSQVETSSNIKRSLFYWALDVGKMVLAAKAKGERPPLLAMAQYELAKKLVFSKISDRFGGRMKLSVSGSAPLAKNIQEFMYIVGIPVLEGYGLTETCAPISVNTPENTRFGSVGKLLSEVLVKIADDGEILIKSEKNFKGYYKDPEATKEAIKDGWFCTGDIGHLDDDGYLFITDRKKDLIKTAGGKYIAPQKIENLAKAENILSHLVLYGDQRPYAVALVTLSQEFVLHAAKSEKILYGEYTELLKNPVILKLVDAAIASINTHLAKYETVKRYHILANEFTVEEGELTPSLKVKRKYLTQKYMPEIEALYGN